MEKVIVSSSLSRQFPGWENEMEICDEAGRTLGYFLPPQLHRQLRYAWAKGQFSDEERAEARQELEQAGGLSTADAIGFLQGLAATGDAVS
jgi:hypothetical protein